MATTITNPPTGRSGFFANLVSDDASGVEEIVAAVSGKSIFVDHLSIASDSAIAISVGEGEAIPGAIDEILLGPMPFGINQQLSWNFLHGGVKLTEAKSLVVGSSAAGNICLFVSGRIE